MLHIAAGIRCPEGVPIVESLLKANANPNITASDIHMSFEPTKRKKVRPHVLCQLKFWGYGSIIAKQLCIRHKLNMQHQYYADLFKHRIVKLFFSLIFFSCFQMYEILQHNVIYCYSSYRLKWNQILDKIEEILFLIQTQNRSLALFEWIHIIQLVIDWITRSNKSFYALHSCTCLFNLKKKLGLIHCRTLLTCVAIVVIVNYSFILFHFRFSFLHLDENFTPSLYIPRNKML